jgi:hypothetical protein
MDFSTLVLPGTGSLGATTSITGQRPLAEAYNIHRQTPVISIYVCIYIYLYIAMNEPTVTTTKNNKMANCANQNKWSI